uniref:Uncharacterized protein n=1 Tax=Timema monikensis TaxID=170555 RepID=A0A7R9EJH4_9NEOP|nr:unnamed protein product [Timema monikensis]
MTSIKYVLGILEPIEPPSRREVGLHLLIADDNPTPHCAHVVMQCPERNDIVLMEFPVHSLHRDPLEYGLEILKQTILCLSHSHENVQQFISGASLDSTIVSEETIPAQVQQQILTIINNDYQRNTQQYIEDNIFEFAEFVYADIDVTNYFRYYLDDITIIDIKNYASDFLKDRQSLLLEQNIEVMSLDDIHTNIDTVSNGSFELSITNRSLGDFTSMQQLGNALYSYNETAEYFNLNTYVTEDTEVVSGDGVAQEVREQIETVIKETYFYKDWDAIDTYISMYMAGRSRDEDLNINDYIHQ